MGLFKKRTEMNTTGKTLGEINKQATSRPPAVKPTHVQVIEVTEDYKEIKRLIDIGEKLILVTGGAGTGKSTFIKWVEGEFSGTVAVAAPTGIAALTISGITIHRLCKLPPAWIVDTDIKVDPKSIVSKIKILIIDEISMVNANLLDAIDKYCKLNRKNSKPFGGLTVIMVGDLFQLPPIVTSTTKPLFQREYSSAKFFAAKSVSNSAPSGIELTSVFRQKDEQLIFLLNNIREGRNLEETIKEFNDVCKVTLRPPIGAIHLAPRNRDVELINSQELEKLSPPEVTFKSVLTGKFSEKQLPAPDKVSLRVGAQIVLLNNTKEWVNGNSGIVTAVSRDKVLVRLIHSNKTVEVKPNEWKNYDYVYNEDEERVERKIIGSYTQIPIALAWAMTIHKSQGLTLDKVHLNLGSGAFETGQTYVALSRVRSMADITLARTLTVSDVLVDNEAVEFYNAIRN